MVPIPEQDQDPAGTSLDHLPATRDLLTSWTESGELLGAHVHVSHGSASHGSVSHDSASHGRRILADVAIGGSATGQPFRPSDVGRLYCAVKPVVAVCLARAVQLGAVTFDTPIHELIDVPATEPWRAVDIRGLLSHRSGLWPSHDNPYLFPFASYLAMISRDELPPTRWTDRPIYNTTVAWHLLAAVVERSYRQPVDEVVRTVVAAPIGAESLCLVHPRAADYVPLYLRAPGATFRELADAPPGVLFTRPNPAHGGFSRNADLGRFYAALLDCRSGAGVLLNPQVIDEMTRHHSTLNEGSRQQHRWGLGFELAVAPRYFGVGWGQRSFGHTGAVGYVGQSPPRVFSLALADPDTGVVVSLRLASVDARSGWRLARLGRALTTDLAGYLA